ncbi:MAG: hypothetical protein ACETWG_01990 [Candidatus Neomarinimicrobiota bacterium]
MKGSQWSAALITVWLAAATVVSAQIEFHGEVYPLARLTFKEKYLSLPHRFISLEGQRQGRNVSLFFSTALEYRLGADTASLDLREAYAELSTNLGDFRIGKQITAWGAADGNNPTDNVSPYDFFYLFLPGTDRKLGNLAASANLYLGHINVAAIATPVFRPNRLPLNEPDFPILGETPFRFDKSLEQLPARELENTEFGLRMLLPLSLMDISVSYFIGFDRMFSPFFSYHELMQQYVFTGLGYHRTQAFGGDIVTFLGDWALRSEGAYFLTEDEDGDDPFIRNPYIQYVLQLDRADDNSNLVVQYLGTYITKIDGDSAQDISTRQMISEEENEQDNIPATMGMPFAAIAQNAVLATASCDFADGRYSLQGQVLYELDHKGYMVGGKLTATLEEAFDLELGLTYLNGAAESRLHTIGDVFSHCYMAMKYSF